MKREIVAPHLRTRTFEDVESIEFLRIQKRHGRPLRHRTIRRQYRRGVMGVQRKEFTSRTTLAIFQKKQN